jgi:hypothetical protein
MNNYFPSSAATALCEACDLGKYSDTTDKTACKACAAGTYTDVKGLPAC